MQERDLRFQTPRFVKLFHERTLRYLSTFSRRAETRENLFNFYDALGRVFTVPR